MVKLSLVGGRVLLKNAIIIVYISVSVTGQIWYAPWHTSVYLDTREAGNVEVKGVFCKGFF